MKKFLSLILAAAMMMAFIPAVNAAGGTANITVDTVTECIQGTAGVKVYVRMGNTPHWGAMDLRITFDTERLTFKSFSLNPELQSQSADGTNIYLANSNKLDQGKYIINFASACSKGGYEGYYGGEYDYFGCFTFDVPATAEPGFAAVTAEVRELAVIVNDEAQSVEYAVTDGGVEVLCDHSWILSGHKDADCLNDGYDKYYCKKCKEYKTDVIAALDHQWGEWAETKAATCSEPGEETRVCQRDSSHTETRATSINPDAHKWGKWELTTEATCSAPGIETRRCEHSKEHFETRETEINPEAHEWTVIGRSDPTCDAAGWVEYICSHNSAHTKRDPISKTGHQWGEWTETRAATCTQPGQETRVCSKDPSHTETRETEINPKAHDWSSWRVTRNNNCTDPGEETRTCRNNPEHVETRETGIDENGHDWDEWKTVNAATCSSKGMEARICKITPEHTETRETEIIPDAHDWTEWETTKEASYEEDGEMKRYCRNNPDHVETKAIPALKHNFGDWIETTKPTCTEDGEETRYCTDPGCTYFETRPVTKLGHDWGTWVETKEATCMSAGEETRVCKNNFAHTETRETKINPDAHSWGGWETVKEATCSAKGEEERICENNPGHIETRETEINPDAHDWTDWTVTTEPTYDAAGEETRYCKNNSGHVETREVPKLERPYMLGDFDKDGSITVADALAALRIGAKLVEETSESIAIGDVDRDGHVTVADALAILRVAARLTDHF